MEKYATKYFGEIDFGKLEEWYETEVELNNEVIEVSISISSKQNNLSKDDFQKVDDYLENLKANENDIRKVIYEDFQNEGETLYYIESQIEEQDKEDITDLIKSANKKLTKKEKLLSVLKISGIRFYPEKEDNMFAVYDFTIDEDLTDQLLAVKIYKDDTITIDIES